eukprot:3381019-Prymnesium_polylepis.1
MRLLRFAGWLMGQTVCNRATLQARAPPPCGRHRRRRSPRKAAAAAAAKLIRLPTPSFTILAGAAAAAAVPQAGGGVRVCRRRGDAARALRKLSDADFGALLELEETPGLSRGEYVDAAVRRLLVDSIGWQFDAFREGFAQALPASRLRA